METGWTAVACRAKGSARDEIFDSLPAEPSHLSFLEELTVGLFRAQRVEHCKEGRPMPSW